VKKISLPVLGKLAEMICGDEPYSYLPYRSSSALTKFFGDLDLNYVHDGSTRRSWVRSVLEELNTRPATTKDVPSREMIKVIEYLLHPDHFISTNAHDQDKAIASVNECLRPYEICVTKAKRTHTVKLHPLYDEFYMTNLSLQPLKIANRRSSLPFPQKCSKSLQSLHSIIWCRS
jgi:hypothetical protein